MQLSKEAQQRIVRNIRVSMRAEGLSVSEKTQKDCYAVLSGKSSADRIVQRCIAAHAKTK